MQGVFSAPRIVAGAGAIETLSGLGALRPLVVVDPGLARATGPRRVAEELEKPEGAVVTTVSDVTVGPTIADIERAVPAVRGAAPDLFVAVGGGSTIDTAKALWVRYVRPDVALESVTPIVELDLRSRARFVAVPTTSGSGSEATWTSELRADDGRPVDLATRELVPDWALLDASLADSAPPQVRADAAADLLGHAIEALGSEWGNAFSDAVGRDALATALTVLPKLARHPDDDDARAALHHAATLAGLAASNAQVGVAHALARALGPSTGLSHGRLVGVLLPYATEFNFPSARDRYRPARRPARSAARPEPERARRTAPGGARSPRDSADARRRRSRPGSSRWRACCSPSPTRRGPPRRLRTQRVPSEEELGRLCSTRRGTARP